jgi:hypothetical protein
VVGSGQHRWFIDHWLCHRTVIDIGFELDDSYREYGNVSDGCGHHWPDKRLQLRVPGVGSERSGGQCCIGNCIIDSCHYPRHGCVDHANAW